MRHLAWLLLLCGCKTLPWSTPKLPSADVTPALAEAITPEGCDPTLSLVGGLCCVAGMVLMVVTKGTMGIRPVLGGAGFVILNYILCRYAEYFFIPAAVVTGAISLAWGGKIVYKIINDDKIKLGDLKL